MSSILLTPPAIEPVSLAEAKAWLRVEHDDDDEVIAALVAGARLHVEAQIRRALITQSWRLSREGVAFTAELRGLAHRLQEDSGRLYTATCNADLGDTRCALDLAGPTFTGTGSVAALSATSTLTAAGLDAYDADGLPAAVSHGRRAPIAGLAVEVKSHRSGPDGAVLELWQMTPEPIAAGDGFTVTAGCDKRLDTCIAKFNNAVNFRGFPHIPGNDFVMRYPVQGEAGNTGGKLR